MDFILIKNVWCVKMFLYLCILIKKYDGKIGITVCPSTDFIIGEIFTHTINTKIREEAECHH